MSETPEEFFERVVGEVGSPSNLKMPPVAEWDTFPFEGDMRVRPFLAPSETDVQRRGEDPAQCWRCQNALEAAIWADDQWVLTHLGKPSGLPVVTILFPRVHCDIHDLPDHLTNDLGSMLKRVESAVRSVGDIGRVHIGRWGDGSAHLHWWFLARPARIPQLVGSFAAVWDDILPPLPERLWKKNLVTVAKAMEAGGGGELIDF